MPIKQIIIFCSIFVIFVLTILSCKSKPGAKEYHEMGDIPKDNENLAVEQFSKYSVETQIDVYLFSLCCVEGSNHGYIRLLANNGETKIPQIVQGLDRADDLRVKYYLIDALYLIDYHCSSCVRENKEVLNILLKNKRRVYQTDDDITKNYKELYNDVLLRLAYEG
jgi:hypothetical protein